MRIRHPPSMPSSKLFEASVKADSPGTQTARTHLVNGSVAALNAGSSLSPPLTENKRVSPQLSKSDGYVSPGPVGTIESTDETNTTYLKPDFYDPLVLTKSEPVSPSPLAMLAKTCQNIGQMMEASFHTSHSTQSSVGLRQVSGTQPFASSTSANSTVTNTMATSMTAVNGTTSSSTATMQGLSPTGPRAVKTIKSTSPTKDGRTVINGKRASISNRFRWMRPDPTSSSTTNANNSISIRKETVSSSTSHGDFIPNSRADALSTSCQKAVCSIPSTYSIPSCPINSCLNSSTTFSLESSSFRDSPASSSQQPTSNALAQLARLSSSLSLPDPPRSVNGVIEGAAKDRLAWTDPLRIQTGTKRARRNSGLGLKGFPVVSNPINNAIGGGVKKSAKDCYPHSHPPADHSMNGGRVSRSSSANATAASSQNGPVSLMPPTAQSSPTSDSQSTIQPWMALAEFIHQMMDRKPEPPASHPAQTETVRLPNQDQFSYNLARSFLDLFYNRMMMMMSTTTTNGLTSSATDNFQQITNLFCKDSGSTSQAAYFPKDLLFPGSQSHINPVSHGSGSNSFGPSLPSQQPAAFSELEQSTDRTTVGERCFFCGQQCASHNEWFMHIYAHMVQFEREQHWQPPPTTNNRDSVNRLQDFHQTKLMPSSYQFLPPPPPTQHSPNAPNLLSRPSPNAEYMSMINSYLANWMGKHKDMNGTKVSPSTPPYSSSFGDGGITTAPSPYANPINSSDSVSSRPTDYPIPKLTDSAMYLYWMHLYAAYCNDNLTARSSTYPLSQQTNTVHTPTAPCTASSSNLGWSHSVMSAFNMTGQSLGIYPKV